ncbi:MAG: 5-(carboxyamino)imidazole ribonucleotide synthase, partial [Microthrixaceae bacterium]|nr:5-(carboxyamino)imidazole ribonucleotide synthase [Microthrixaceae bacterium]
MTVEPVVGVIGGGQLARMLAEAASPLGVHLRVLASPSDEGAAAVVVDTVLGDH